MPIFLEHFIIDLTDIIKILFICVGVINMPLKKSSKSFFMASILFIISSFTKWYIYKNQDLNKYLLLVMMISLIIIMQCLLSIKKVNGLLFLLLLFFMNGNLDGIVSIIILVFIGNNNSFTIEKINICSSIITVIFILLLIFSCRKKVKGDYLSISTFKLIFLILASFTSSIFLSFLIAYLDRLELITKEKFFTFLIIGIAFEMYLQIYLYILLCINADFYKDRNYLSQCLLDAQKKYFNYLQEKEEATRSFRHDMNSHIYVLKSLCEKQNWESMDQYIERINQENIKNNHFLQTGNSVVDAICNLYIEKANKENISIFFSGNMPDKINIEDFDLCIIFTNLLSNAIEAVRIGEIKNISLEIRYDENNIYIREENYFTMPVKHKGNKFLTTKKDSNLHGYGIQNLKESVYKYRGYVQIETENGIWKMNICIPYFLF